MQINTTSTTSLEEISLTTSLNSLTKQLRVKNISRSKKNFLYEKLDLVSNQLKNIQENTSISADETTSKL